MFGKITDFVPGTFMVREERAELDQFCLRCFAMMPATAKICPHCGSSVSEFDRKSYFERLLNALFHPLADCRMRAIVVLGLLGKAKSAEALVECALRHPTDVPEGLEVVRSLARIEDPAARSSALRRIAVVHPAHGVRYAASEVLKDLKPSTRDGQEE